MNYSYPTAQQCWYHVTRVHLLIRKVNFLQTERWVKIISCCNWKLQQMIESESGTFFKLWTTCQQFSWDDSDCYTEHSLTCKTLLSASSPVRTSTFSRMHFLAVALVYAAADSSRDSVTLWSDIRTERKPSGADLPTIGKA